MPHDFFWNTVSLYLSNTVNAIQFIYCVITPRQIGFLIFLFIQSNVLYGQTSDKLLKDSLSAHLGDTVGVNILNQLAQANLFKDTQLSIQYAEQAKELAQKLNFSKGLTRSLNQLGAGYWSKGDLKKSLGLFQQSLQMAEETGNVEFIARNIGSQGLIFAASGMHGTAIQYYKRALPLYRQLGIMERVTASYNNIGKAFLELKQYDSASKYLVLAQEHAGKLNLKISIIPFNLADLYFQLKRLEESKQYLDSCLKLAKEINDARSLARHDQLLAEILLEENLPSQAEDAAQQSVLFAEKTKSKEVMYISYLTYANVLSMQKKYDQAYSYHKRYTQLKDSLVNSTLQNMLILNEYTLKQNEINRLVEQSKLLEAKESQKIIIITSLVITLLLVGLLTYYFAYSRNQRRKMNILLVQKNFEINEQNRLLELKTYELSQMDDFKNKVLSIISHDLRGPFHSLRGLLQSPLKTTLTSSDVRVILKELSKHVSTITSLTDTLLVWATNQLQGPKVTLSVFNLLDCINEELANLQTEVAAKELTISNTVAPELKVNSDPAIIKIVSRNVIVNAIKFSTAGGRIEITAHLEAQHIRLAITDHGAGMSTATSQSLLKKSVKSAPGTAGEKGTGVGLLLCKDLIERVNGKLSFVSEIEKGTTFYIDIPSAS